MTVAELIAKLLEFEKAGKGNAVVYFDTNGRDFDYHVAKIGDVFVEDGEHMESDYDYCIFHEEDGPEWKFSKPEIEFLKNKLEATRIALRALVEIIDDKPGEAVRLAAELHKAIAPKLKCPLHGVEGCACG